MAVLLLTQDTRFRKSRAIAHHVIYIMCVGSAWVIAVVVLMCLIMQ
jgi:hypothetical protein